MAIQSTMSIAVFLADYWSPRQVLEPQEHDHKHFLTSKTIQYLKEKMPETLLTKVPQQTQFLQTSVSFQEKIYKDSSDSTLRFPLCLWSACVVGSWSMIFTYHPFPTLNFRLSQCCCLKRKYQVVAGICHASKLIIFASN
jgi:hypothetical protein